ncbi:hypothetical protein [Terrisporobacter petrolearius]|uniref:hypothetical protein n=1 Tax=Terrisporobacter petrolearius TaxID=1460447 RepID=UPI0022E910FC|nr:hypothetical protein [Terrisporobacter petrolearius]
MNKRNYTFNFNCSKNILITKLDKLKVVNADNSTNTNLLCRRINNKIKFMLYTNYTPGTYSIMGKGVVDIHSFEGEIFEKDSKSYISGHFKSSLYVRFFTVLVFAFCLMLIFNIYLMIEILFFYLGIMIFFKKHTEYRLLNKIKEFEKNINLHI